MQILIQFNKIVIDNENNNTKQFHYFQSTIQR